MAEKPAAEAPAPKSSKLVPALMVGNSLLLAGVIAVVLLRGGGHAPAAAAPAHGAAPAAEGAAEAPGVAGAGAGPTVKLPDFVVRLRDPDGDRFCRIAFEVELGAETDKEKFARYVPRIRDSFISYLADRSAPELAGSDGLGKVKADLAKRIDEAVPGRIVRSLYITDFVVQ